MEHSLNFISQFTTTSDDPKRQKLKAFHFDNSGHVVATNAHVLFASKAPFNIKHANKTFCNDSFIKTEKLNEATLTFPEWKQILPIKSAKKVNIFIPKWFSELDKLEEEQPGMILNYDDTQNPFFKIGNKTSASSFAFNAKFLAPFAGQNLTAIIDGPLQPVVILKEKSDIDPLSKNLKDQILNEEWFYMMMPLKVEEELKETEVYI